MFNAASKTDNVSAEANYIESVFSTYLYTGTGASQTITNNIDTTTYGGLVWIKGRSGATGHRFTDTARGTTKSLESNSTAAEVTESTGLTAFGTTGFTIGADADYNTNAATYASWTFRKQAKFFDIVTYTGNGANRTISHNLGSVPGCIIVKRTDTTADWQVYHRSLANTEYLVLNTTDAKATGATRWNSTTPTSTEFSLGTDATVNANGGTYVAYLFAHDAGGFGTAGTDNVISCGSFTTNSSTDATVNLGYEPQWVLLKRTSTTGDWRLPDTMRGFSVNSVTQLFPNVSNAETTTSTTGLYPTATGFATSGFFSANQSFIYIAIRRGPMKTPTSGTSVFEPVTYTKTNTNNRVINTTITPDLVYQKERTASSLGWAAYDRIRGPALIQPNSTIAQSTSVSNEGFSSIAGQNGVVASTTSDAIMNDGSADAVLYALKRAPQFLDVIFISATGFTASSSHNLTVVPELVIQKRMGGGDWSVAYNIASGGYSTLVQNDTSAGVSRTYGNGNMLNSQPTSTSIAFDNTSSGQSYVAYLFATCTGVSKVGSYTGTGTTLQINCGFTGGARFVLIKRTDSTGDWYVWDSARGIVAGNDPYLLLNSTAAEVTNTDYVDAYSAGFEISSTAPAAINASGGSYIYLAIA